jgi:hypothetical protein
MELAIHPLQLETVLTSLDRAQWRSKKKLRIEFHESMPNWRVVLLTEDCIRSVQGLEATHPDKKNLCSSDVMAAQSECRSCLMQILLDNQARLLPIPSAAATSKVGDSEASLPLPELLGKVCSFQNSLLHPNCPATRFDFTFVDLFAGIGGFRVALESLGGVCQWSCEIDNAARQIYALNFGKLPDAADITLVDETKIPHHDILTAGFPCQPFSVLGQQNAFQDHR